MWWRWIPPRTRRDGEERCRLSAGVSIIDTTPRVVQDEEEEEGEEGDENACTALRAGTTNATATTTTTKLIATNDRRIILAFYRRMWVKCYICPKMCFNGILAFRRFCFPLVSSTDRCACMMCCRIESVVVPYDTYINIIKDKPKGASPRERLGWF